MLMTNPENSAAGPDAGSVAPTLDPRWRRAAWALAAVTILQIGLFWEASSTMVDVWYRSATFNHGFLIFPIAGYLVWLRRDHLFAAVPVPRPALSGLALLALGAALWLLADAADILLIQQFALVGMIQVSVLAILGWRATMVLAFPLAYMLFAVPFGEFMVPWLQVITAKISVEALRLVSIPVFIDGLFIQIPSGRFLVAEACSGVRFLIASVALGTLFAHLMYRTLWRRILFIALALTVPILANGLRAFGIIILAHVSDHKLAVGVDHLVYGWIFFSLVIVMLFALGMAFRERHAAPRDDAPPATAVVDMEDTAMRRRFTAIVTGIVLIALAAPGYATLREGPVAPSAALKIVPPAVGGGWQSAANQDDSWRPVYVGADATLRHTYVKDGRRVYLYIAYYAQQRQGSELISQINKLSDGKFWTWGGGGMASASLAGTPMQVRLARISGRHGRRMIWHWYWLDGTFTASSLVAKWREAKSQLFGGRRGSAAIAVAADFTDAPAEAVPALRDFLRHLGPLRSDLRKVSDE